MMFNHRKRAFVHSRLESGYVLLSILVLGAILIVTAAAVLPNIITQGTREKEAELIWRGNQYARAVKLFYRKNGRFPTSMDQLTKRQGNIRYLRQEYKDPFNREDGKWRMIYVLPNGQLIGSLTRVNILLQIPGQQPQPAGQPGQSPAGLTPQAGTPTGQGGRPASPQTGTSGSTFGASGQTIGGNIIGVGSKVPQQSIKVFNGAQTYREWEFMWDPARDAQAAGVAGGVPGGQPGGIGQPPPPPPRPGMPPRRP